jgi:TPR repeat protein
LALSGCAEIGASVSGFVDEVSETLKPLLESDAEQAVRAEALHREAVALDAQERPEAAAEMFRQAAELDHAAAAYALGEAYNRGHGVAPDPALAAEWFNRAAARGEPRARFLIGAAYAAGVGVTQDHGVAVTYLTKAAEQGHPRAQFLLAEAFANGRGVGKDLAWAARWYGLAAIQGHRRAQYAYGVLYAAALGLPRNDVAAHAWLSLAAAAGHAQAAAARNAVARRLAGADIERAENWARRFVPGAGGSPGDPPTIIYVQQQLNALGYEAGSADGVLGPRTQVALSAYQSAKGLDSNGRITPRLLQSLRTDAPRSG